MNPTDYTVRYRKMIEAAAEAGRQEMYAAAPAGLIPKLSLWYRPTAAEMDGALKLSSESPGPAWRKGSDDVLAGNVPYANYETWVRERARSLPVLGADSKP